MSDPVGTTRRPVTRWCDGKLQPETDLLAVEIPVALEFNGISHAVMLATPTELDEFALGFALSEEIIAGRSEFRGAEVSTGTTGITVHCEIAPNAFFKLKQKRRSMTGRTGCGLCGTESLEQVIKTPRTLAGTATIRVASIDAALNELSTRQPLSRLTGGLHAAGWSDERGRLQQVCEDVGRHNALDKLIGKMAAQGLDFRGGFLVISSRASVEMVQKAAVVGIHCLVAISAPTSLAVEAAESSGMTLIAFARADTFVAYTKADRLTINEA